MGIISSSCISGINNYIKAAKEHFKGYGSKEAIITSIAIFAVTAVGLTLLGKAAAFALANAFVFTIVLGPLYKKTYEVHEKKIDFAHIKGSLLPINLIKPDQHFHKAIVVFQSNIHPSGCYLFSFNKTKEEFDSFWENIYKTMENEYNDPKDVTGIAYALYQTQDGRFHYARIYENGSQSSYCQLKTTLLEEESILESFNAFHEKKLNISSVIRQHFSNSPE